MNQPAELWSEENGEHINELNQILKDKMGQEFEIKMYFGKELEWLTEKQLLEIANCYKEVFNESWGESWTTESALKEVRENFTWCTHRIPVAAFLCVDSRIVGFAWALLQESEYLMERDMPFDLPIKEKRIGLKVSRYWLDTVVRKKKYSCGEK